MRKHRVFGISALIGGIVFLLLAQSNWFLAIIFGAVLGATLVLIVYAYPNDIAPPADRRHENTQRRRSKQGIKN